MIKLTANDVISGIYELESKNKYKECCIYIGTEFHYLIRNDIEVIEEVFNLLDFTKLSSWSQISLLRLTFSFKETITRWKDLLIFTKEYFDSKGYDTQKNLYGLL